jgi:hypothetical protein
MIVATVLAALLMGGLLLMTGALARDRNRITRAESGGPLHSTLLDLIRFDLTNAMTMSASADGKFAIFVGHGGLDPQSLQPTGRLTRVTYEIRGSGRDAALFRRQEFLDDPARLQPFTELVADGVQALGFFAGSSDSELVKKRAEEDDETANLAKRRRQLNTFTVPSRVTVSVQRQNTGITQEVWVR